MKNDLSCAENKYVNLNNSVKDITSERVEVEHRFDEEIMDLSTQLKQTKEDNAKLKVALIESKNVDHVKLLKQNEKKLAVLQEERKCMLTTIEVLQEDLRALRAEITNLEARHEKNNAEADLLTEMTLAAANNDCSSSSINVASSVAGPDVTNTSCQPSQLPSLPLSSSLCEHDSLQSQNDFGRVLLIGDSHLRYTSVDCKKRGAYVECCPGGRIRDIKSKLLNYLDVELDLIYFTVGTNNLKKNYRGGPGYNGGHGKREVLHAMADLLYTARTQFKNSKIILNSILIRKDIGYRALHDFNDQLSLMCNNFGVTFVEANCCVGRRDLARDGVHFNRRGVARLASLFVDIASRFVRTRDAATVSPFCVQSEASPPVPPPSCSTEIERAACSSFANGDSDRRVSGGLPQTSGN